MLILLLFAATVVSDYFRKPRPPILIKLPSKMQPMMPIMIIKLIPKSFLLDVNTMFMFSLFSCKIKRRCLEPACMYVAARF